MKKLKKHIISLEGDFPDQSASTVEGANKVEGGSVIYKFSAKGVLIWLIVVTLIFNSIGVIGRGIEYLMGIKETTPVVHLFHVAEEGNLTTWFSALLLLVCCMLLALIATVTKCQGKRYWRHWGVLSGLFFYLSLDEAAAIHELAIEPLRALFNTAGIFYYAWVIPAIVLLAVLAIFYAKFLRDLPRRSSVLFMVAGIIYVFGAIGMDMAVGVIITRQLPRLFEPALITIEEMCENFGVILFIYALLLYIKSHIHVSRFQFQVV